LTPATDSALLVSWPESCVANIRAYELGGNGRNHQMDCSAVADGQLDARQSSAILAPEEIEMITDGKYYKTRNRPLSLRTHGRFTPMPPRTEERIARSSKPWITEGTVTQRDEYIFLADSWGRNFDAYDAAYFLQSSKGYPFFYDTQTWDDAFHSEFGGAEGE
jgi:hypothetical protein